ncbi:uncharacterized protein LOC126885680 isoform X1 [Diabrotica virgifera virgifera]|uniref:Uncharacterized protein n=1 Tax=Diabrotica virgifera virgifera TaxID=50390 RepID=A0ABM5KDR2_DIAVI|nr:uncharacterized protein LOC126885680 isoform X1 [Diabrotica virgifera virgifera]
MKFFKIFVFFVCFTVSIYADREYKIQDCLKPYIDEDKPIIGCYPVTYKVWRWDIKSKSCVEETGICGIYRRHLFKSEDNGEDECNKVARPVCEKLYSLLPC